MSVIQRCLIGGLFTIVSVFTIIVFILCIPIGFVIRRFNDPMKINFTKISMKGKK
ncbi:MAG: hypothetical protein ACK5WP_09330 [Neisseriaceae bacterium]|jgi:H+/gluconate symporter-like permease